ncbi:exonuclease [Fulvitalea axinellae]|uniref:Exonuclease n=1 Tax=Fulvitalea axinellae TaxID=1182444 RepID=A0AAU9CT44_9BACT|nr:exonuclease [Fulvitalea axinellae]
MALYAVLDIETTGGNTQGERITEIAVFLHDGENVIDEFHTLVNPERSIPPFISNLTGITNDMVKSSPRFFEVAKRLVEITEGATVVAHNAAFDYNFIRREFRELGFEFKRKTLCTVKMSRKLIPGEPSYSLGKLTKSLGIPLDNHHRAKADAYATVKLFELLLATDKEKSVLEDKSLVLHPALSRETLSDLPEEAGVYFFYDEHGNVIYVGKSVNVRQRVFSHFYSNKTKRAIEMRQSVADIDCVVTGSELVALLRESHEIKTLRPKYNRAQRRQAYPYGVYASYDMDGYVRFKIGRNIKGELPVATFASSDAAKNTMFKMVEDYSLCQKLCGLYDTKNACFGRTLKQCAGACVGEELPDAYNLRAQAVIDKFSFSGESFIILDKGRVLGERSVVVVENGRYLGFGFVPVEDAIESPEEFKTYINTYADNKDIRQILKSFLSHKKPERIIKYDEG